MSSTSDNLAGAGHGKPARLEKRFPVFDCDAHLTETPDIWDHLSSTEREEVRPWYWPDGNYLVINGTQRTPGVWAIGRCGDTDGYHTDRRRVPNRVEIVGPGSTKAMIRKLYSMSLSDEQLDFAERRGARDPHARMAEMDLQGIDQVVVIPLSMLSGFNAVTNDRAAVLMARAYNDWVRNWCSPGRDRLFPAAVLPLVAPREAADELGRAATLGMKVAMVRPIALRGKYPLDPAFDPLWDKFCETGLVIGMHTLGGPGTPWGNFLHQSADSSQMPGPAPSRCLGFVHEAMLWIASMLLSGFLERRPALPKMAIMESNASWLPLVLEQCDRAALGGIPGGRINLRQKPSETFFERCFIAFEGDEEPVYRQHPYFENIGIWSSDLPHIDGSDAWTAIREMSNTDVPEAVQAKLLGGNARRMYGVEPRIFTTLEPETYGPQPAWFPTPDGAKQEFSWRITG